ncbi:MAG: ABC transporter substrate-binding protein [Proteobacteria bacterium]|nr:ABC transporter substrate-binding protein [Pseudomonadota bacterium]
MSTRSKNIFIGLLVSIFLGFIVYELKKPHSTLPIITIANYGPHSSLEETIRGIKEGLEEKGFKENETISFKISHVNFDHSLIPQMISNMMAHNPKIMVALSTPIAQVLKNSQKNVPIVFSAITDPVESGLVRSADKSHENVTGSSDQQDLELFLIFAKDLLPNAKRVGIMRATADANDFALVRLMEKAAQKLGFKVVVVPVDQARDIPQRMQLFKDKVDFIYVGTSGPIQPALPTIVAEADRMNIPVFNADSEAVYKNQVLGSFGVTYYQVGRNAALLIDQLLKGKNISDVPPLYPSPQDHHGFISKKRAEKLGITNLNSTINITVIE